jgi:intracellular multiplication protein IcmD
MFKSAFWKENKTLILMIGMSILVLAIFFISNSALAQDTNINENVKKGVKGFANTAIFVMQVVAYVAGTGFVFTSFFKFDQHKKNPTQIPLSQPLTLLAIGAGLLVLPQILNGLKASLGVTGDQSESTVGISN